MKRFLSATLAMSAFATGAACAQGAAPPDPARDHAAILAMRGEHVVSFAFDETVLLQPGYERHAPLRSGGDEVVIVVEDTPTRVVLQHILVDPKSGHVTKHWRQDWTYEAPSRFEFSADQTWTVRALSPAETRGAWTQCVYEVSDAPRYCGTGKWNYDDGVATWTSDATWRPLPRREYTKRSDYNALRVVNRQTIVPGGWTHEQFNTKVLRKPDGSETALAREVGFDDYRKTTEIDFTPAYDYWKATSGYWAKVRARWDRWLSQPQGLHLKTKIDGMAMIVPLFEQADAVQSGKSVGDAKIDAVFAQWVEPATVAKRVAAASAPATNDHFGVLVMAHGGGERWNNEVSAALAPMRDEFPMEIAFGMADAASLQQGVDALRQQGVRRIGVVRLFVSGDSFYKETRQIFGLEPGAPPRPAQDHAMHDMPGMDHGDMSMAFWRVDSDAAFALSKDGLADAPEMGQVLAARARALSRDPAHEDVLVLAHGPGDDAENARWIANIDARADAVRKALPFRRVQVMTLREDWPDKREAATREIRDFVQRAGREGGRAIVIPYRVQGFGPYKDTLAGLDYASDGVGLVPDPQVTAWVRREAEELRAGFDAQAK